MSEQWRHAVRCANTNCVEVTTDRGLVLVRDSKDPQGPALGFLPHEWAAFVAGVRAGEFDLPEAAAPRTSEEGGALAC